MSAGATVTLLYLSALVVATAIAVYVALAPSPLSVPEGCSSVSNVMPARGGWPAQTVTVVTCPNPEVQR